MIFAVVMFALGFVSGFAAGVLLCSIMGSEAGQ